MKTLTALALAVMLTTTAKANSITDSDTWFNIRRPGVQGHLTHGEWHATIDNFRNSFVTGFLEVDMWQLWVEDELVMDIAPFDVQMVPYEIQSGDSWTMRQRVWTTTDPVMDQLSQTEINGVMYIKKLTPNKTPQQFAIVWQPDLPVNLPLVPSLPHTSYNITGLGMVLPEPSALLLACCGVGLLAGWRRR